MAELRRVADVACDILTANGIKHVFLVTGGGAMHLNDAIGRNKNLEYVACHHEQACAMAAESYFRMSGNLAAVNVTTGPGGTNAITGVYGAWTDSIGMVVISGQVKWETLVRSTRLPLRQLGDQEIDIVKMVESITKYSVMITDAKTIKYHLEKAIYLAKTGRPGPVWIDIPINIQSAMVNPDELIGFKPTEENIEPLVKDYLPICQAIKEKIKTAKRPVVLVGGGIRIGKAHSELIEFINSYKIPLVTAWNAHDAVEDENPYYVGRPGSVGDRAGNFAVQNSDLLIILGCRLNIRQISYNWKSFARAAYKIMVDIDQAELQKPTLDIDLPIHAHVKLILTGLLQIGTPPENSEHKTWVNWCKERQKKYPVVLKEYWAEKESVNPYCFIDKLFSQLNKNERIVTGDGTACVVTFQAAQLKQGQRLYTNSGCASMGYDLPGAIGAYFSEKPNRVICLAGDGSIQMNLQELQTIVTYKIPAKIFVLNNQGYHSIRQTQQNFFKDNVIGCGVESGLAFPDMAKLAHAYGIGFQKITNHSELEQGIAKTLNQVGPQICEVILDLKQQFSPKLSSKKLPDGKMVTTPLEDMAPFLSREELKENMLIPMWDANSFK
jgi:acetolactate synthase-1/2/3 large subunit